MTEAQLSHVYLETGEKLGLVLIDIRKLDEIHKDWLGDLTKAFETDNTLSSYAFNPEAVRNIEGNFLNGDYLFTIHGLRQLQLAYYWKKYHFDDTRQVEDSLFCDLKNALEVFYRHSDTIFEYKMSKLPIEKRESYYDKLRQWSIYRRIYADTTNEISTLICHDATLNPRPIFLELSLAREVIAQAKYQFEHHLKELDSEEQALLTKFVQDPLFGELESWRI